MGYELRLHIGQEWNFDAACNGQFNHTIREIAMVDISSPGYDSRIYRLVGKYQTAEMVRLNKLSKAKAKRTRSVISTDVYNARSNNYEKLTADKYDKPFVSIPIREVLDALEADWEDSKREYTGWDKGYRRFYIALALIRSIIETFEREHDYLSKDEDLLAINPLAGQLVVFAYGH